MSDPSLRKRHWFRFTLVNVLVLILGISIGLVPLSLRKQAERPDAAMRVHLTALEVPRESWSALGISPDDPPNGDVAARKVGETFSARLQALRKANKVKTLAEPTLQTVDGRPAWFNLNGRQPVVTLAKDGTTRVKSQRFKTNVNLTPTLLYNGRIRLAISTEISDIDSSRSMDVDGVTVPGVRECKIETEIDIEEGETIVLAASEQASRPETEKLKTLVVARVEVGERKAR